MNTPRSNHGFTLLEVMIATVIVVILAIGLAGSMGAAFTADAAARNAAASTNASQQVLEEFQKLDYGDVLACDGDAVLTPEGIAVKISVTEVMVGMLLVDVAACRPRQSRTVLELGGLTMTQFRNIDGVTGSHVHLMTYRAGR